LKANGLGQVLDVVPNHLPVGCDNWRWRKVLTGGTNVLTGGTNVLTGGTVEAGEQKESLVTHADRMFKSFPAALLVALH